MSLLSFSDAIRALAEKKKVKFETNLTKLLRPALSRGSKTVLIVNVSPTIASANAPSLIFIQFQIGLGWF